MCQLEVLPFVVNCLRAIMSDNPFSCLVSDTSFRAVMSDPPFSHVIYFILQRIFILY